MQILTLWPSYPTSASGRTFAKPSGIIGIRHRNHSQTYTVRQCPKTNHSTEFQWKISNNTVTKCDEGIFSFLQRRVWFWFSHNIFEWTESAYSRVGHVNYGQLGNRLSNLWINYPLGLKETSHLRDFIIDSWKGVFALENQYDTNFPKFLSITA